jgi:cytochrome P450
MGKDPVFSLHTPTGVQNILTADRPTHTRQRRLLAHAFSEKALREQEGILQSYTDQLLSGLEARCHQVVDIGAWFMFTTFDLISDLSFGDNVGCLAKGDYDPYVSATPAISKELQYYQMLKYWGIDWARKYFMPAAVLGARQTNMKRAMSTVHNRIERNASVSRKDFLHYILAANDEKGMSRQEIDVNAFSISTAGSESTATALAGAIFYLLQDQQAYQRIVNEIRTAFRTSSEITMTEVKKLQYVRAVLQETMRLYPPVAVTLPRRVPPEEDGVLIAGQPVPAGTTVGVNYYAAFHSPHNFHQPDKFAPERWLPEDPNHAPYIDDDLDVVQPFSFGPRNCLGKNLAWVEMQLVLARLLWRFDVEWEDVSQIDSAWQSKQKLFGFWVKPPLMVRLHPAMRVTWPNHQR